MGGENSVGLSENYGLTKPGGLNTICLLRLKADMFANSVEAAHLKMVQSTHLSVADEAAWQMDRQEAGKKGYEKTGSRLKLLGEERTRRAVEEYEANPKFCLTCGDKLPFAKRRGKFCSHSCAAKYNNQGVTRHTTHSEFCENCGKPKEHRHNKYCAECIEKRIYRKITTLEEATQDRVRRRILIEQRGWRCEICGLTEWLGKPIPIEMDHIDGDTDNNSEENLRLVCLNCHAQTDTYKSLNTGKNSKRQEMRRRRYAEGKTY